jgi:PhnB protein
MKFVTYLNFNGTCREAFEFYAKTLKGEILAMLTHDQVPPGAEVSADWKDKILNAHLKVGDQELMGSDAPPNWFKGVEGFYVSIQIEDEKEGQRIFNALSDRGTVQLPFEPTFWAKRFAMLRDRFGTPWMINVPNAA